MVETPTSILRNERSDVNIGRVNIAPGLRKFLYPFDALRRIINVNIVRLPINYIYS